MLQTKEIEAQQSFIFGNVGLVFMWIVMVNTCSMTLVLWHEFVVDKLVNGLVHNKTRVRRELTVHKPDEVLS